MQFVRKLTHKPALSSRTFDIHRPGKAVAALEDVIGNVPAYSTVAALHFQPASWRTTESSGVSARFQFLRVAARFRAFDSADRDVAAAVLSSADNTSTTISCSKVLPVPLPWALTGRITPMPCNH